MHLDRRCMLQIMCSSTCTNYHLSADIVEEQNGRKVFFFNLNYLHYNKGLFVCLCLDFLTFHPVTNIISYLWII